MSAPHTNTLAGWIITLVLLALAALFVGDRLYNPEQFRIETIEVQGRFHRVNGERVHELAAQSISGNYFSVNLPHIESRVEQLPWVFNASVRRQWPATLIVEVVEVQPVARWGAHHWLHLTGDLVEREVVSESAASALPQDLPLLSAPDERREMVWQTYRKWSRQFAGGGLRLDELRLDARGLWHLQLSLSTLTRQRNATQQATPGPVALIVARENADARIAQFVDVLPQRLLAEFPAMRSIDLRYPNGFAIGWRASSAAATQDSLRTQSIVQVSP